MGRKRILIAWCRAGASKSGGWLLELARELRSRGHEVSVASLPDELARASARSFDAVFLSGSGARPRQVELATRLGGDRRGQRFQFVLDDPSHKAQFERFNRLFRPQVVVFSSSRWQPRDFRRFAARGFVTLPGADEAGRVSLDRTAARLLELVERPLADAYYRLPAAGLFGRWLPEERLLGLEPILENCRGLSVLDLGTAEGAIPHALGQRGAEPIHAFELDPQRVQAAGRALASLDNQRLLARQADLSDPAAFVKEHAKLLLGTYDVVLMLGLYHQLSNAIRDRLLSLALERAGRFLALRADLGWWPTFRIRRKIRRAGFRLVSRRPAEPATRTGWLAVFERRGA